LSQEDHRRALADVLETALDAVIVMKPDGTVADWNEVASHIFGWTRAEAVGSLLSELIIPERLREGHRQGLENYLRTGVGPLLRNRIEVSAIRKTGDEFPIELSITPYRHGDELLFLGFLRDITDRRKAAQVLERQLDQAKLLYEVVAFAAETPSFDDALLKCLEAVHNLTGWPLGHIYLPSEGDVVMMLPSDIWFPDAGGRYENLRNITAQTTFRVGEGLPGSVMQAGEPVWISDVHSDRRFPRAQHADSSLGIASALGFPIKNGKSIIAVVEFFTPVQSKPDTDLLLTVRSIGDQVGRVFERHRAEVMLRAQADHQKLLVAELNHRVKNMLAVVTGIASQTMRNSDSMEQFNRSFLERVSALSQAHSLLASEQWRPTGLRNLVQQIFAPYAEASSQISVSGQDVKLTPKAAIALSLVLHELVTNSAKYGALSKRDGSLSLFWRLTKPGDMRLKFLWSEQGVPIEEKPTKTGFGTRLVRATIEHELRGHIDLQYRDDGLIYEMEWPVALPAESGDAL
jgi:PAS domain S-box-containing protein